MNKTPTQKRSYLEFIRRDQTFLRMSEDELREANEEAITRSITPFAALARDSQTYRLEQIAQYKAGGMRGPCFGTDCDEDRCRCYDAE